MRIKRNLLILLTTVPTIFFFTGCEETLVTVNVENNENISSTVFGKSAMIEIGDCLYYDSTTRIVYWWNNSLGMGQSATTPSPYYAPNGLPYRYNPETNTFEEITTEIHKELKEN